MQLSSNSRSMMSNMLVVLSLLAAAMANPTYAPTQEPSTTPIKAYRAVVIVIVVSCVIGVGMFVMLTIIVAIKRGNACSEHGPCANCCGEQQGAYIHKLPFDLLVIVSNVYIPSFPSRFRQRITCLKQPSNNNHMPTTNHSYFIIYQSPIINHQQSTLGTIINTNNYLIYYL